MIKNIKKAFPKALIIWIILGLCYTASYFLYNTFLTEADSFSYIRMAEAMHEFSKDGFGTGWFGFGYSIILAVFLPFFDSAIFAGQIANIFLLTFTLLLIYTLFLKIFSHRVSLLLLLVYICIPGLLHYRIHLLAENLYIPLFCALILLSWNTLAYLQKKQKLQTPTDVTLEKHSVFLACVLAAIYFTRAEGFIYLGSVALLALGSLCAGLLPLQKFLKSIAIFLISFCVIITPYIFHLHSITGEWGLTNKGASNFRQAELRGNTHMDDAGFEEAVAGLTQDNSQLIAGFAGGMPYTKPQIQGSFLDSLSKYPSMHISRFLENQQKLYTDTLLKILYGNTHSVIVHHGGVFSFLHFLVIGCMFLAGILVSWYRYRVFLFVFLAFFLPASFFFSIFFILERYFVIFVPFFIMFFALGVQGIIRKTHGWLQIFFSGGFVLYSIAVILGTFASVSAYTQLEAEKNIAYSIKKEAGLGLKNKISQDADIKILERFPFVSYYSGAKWRYITPYTQDIQDIVDYARQNDIEYLVVDTLDFLSYRPELAKYITETPDNMELIHEVHTSIFLQEKEEKKHRVRIYKILKK